MILVFSWEEVSTKSSTLLFCLLSPVYFFFIFLNNRLSLVTGYKKIKAAYELVNMVNIIDNIVSSHWVK